MFLQFQDLGMFRMNDFRLGDHSGTLSSQKVSLRAGGSLSLG